MFQLGWNQELLPTQEVAPIPPKWSTALQNYFLITMVNMSPKDRVGPLFQVA